jgi:hypothetical protein
MLCTVVWQRKRGGVSAAERENLMDHETHETHEKSLMRGVDKGASRWGSARRDGVLSHGLSPPMPRCPRLGELPSLCGQRAAVRIGNRQKSADAPAVRPYLQKKHRPGVTAPGRWRVRRNGADRLTGPWLTSGYLRWKRARSPNRRGSRARPPAM